MFHLILIPPPMEFQNQKAHHPDVISIVRTSCSTACLIDPASWTPSAKEVRMSVAEGNRRVISIFWKATDSRLSALLELEPADMAATDHTLIMDDVGPYDLGHHREIEVA